MCSPEKDSLGIYIHVPFCRSKCPYCDFYSVTDSSLIPLYLDALKDEISSLRRCVQLAGRDVLLRKTDSVYFGGGTPSVAGAQELCSVLSCIRENGRLSQDCEITCECNPTLNNPEDFFTTLAHGGFNRISLGMQTADDKLRKALGRKAGRAEVERAVAAAKEAGIDNISLDIMLAFPGDCTENLKRSMDFALSLGVQHISAYIFSLEENSFFGRHKNTLVLPDDDETADMYLFMCSYLENNGFSHYEISNFCSGDFYSRHNTRYWQCREYLGIGAAAHSFIDGKRFYFPRSTENFINGGSPVFDCIGADAGEYLMLKLRLLEGLDTDFFCKKYSLELTEGFFSVIESLEKNSLAVYKNGSLSLTDSGMLLSNSVITQLLNVLKL